MRNLGEDDDEFRSRLYLLDLDAGGLRPLTAADGEAVASPAWSPDGRRVAFTRFATKDERRESQIVVAEADGSGERVVVREVLSERPSGVGHPVWSPDNARIAYTRSVLDRSYHSRSSLYLIAEGGGRPQRLAANAGDAAWSPDGTRIAFVSERDRNGESCGSDQCVYHGELYVMDADGGNQVRLTRNRGIDRSPSWSPDGRRIAFASSRNNGEDRFGFDTELYSFRCGRLVPDLAHKRCTRKPRPSVAKRAGGFERLWRLRRNTAGAAHGSPDPRPSYPCSGGNPLAR